jgi:hypothetical protein
MKYACLVYVDPVEFARVPPAEKEALDRDSIAYDEELTRRGRYLAASALQAVSTARTIRVRGGKTLATDGPFAETKEVLCGFIWIEAEDMAEAVRVAEGVPMARYGSIEVRAELDIRERLAG